MARYPRGQRMATVNRSPTGFVGSTPTLATKLSLYRIVAIMVDCRSSDESSILSTGAKLKCICWCRLTARISEFQSGDQGSIPCTSTRLWQCSRVVKGDGLQTRCESFAGSNPAIASRSCLVISMVECLTPNQAIGVRVPCGVQISLDSLFGKAIGS